jgi:PBSX family phage portal protein
MDKSTYSFGDPEPVQSDRIIDFLGVFPDYNGEYYLPPVSPAGLGSLRYACGQHGSCLVFRRNMAAGAYRGGALSVSDLRRSITDYLTFGNAFFEIRRNGFGAITGLDYVPSINMRVRTGSGFRQLLQGGKYQDFSGDDILHLQEHDTNQQVYGIPDWLGGMQSVLLNQDATVFRRRYYKNGCHLGYIFYTNDTKLSDTEADNIREKLESGRGAGNFKTMFVSIPGGSEKAIQIHKIGEIGQNDSFSDIKNLSAADVREAHRVPPVLMGIIPQGTSSLGDPIKVEQVYRVTEVAAIAQTYEALNDFLPKKLQLKFDYEVKTSE